MGSDRVLLKSLILLLAAAAVTPAVQHDRQQKQEEQKKPKEEHATVRLPPVPEYGSSIKISFQEGFPSKQLRKMLGQVSGVSIDANGRSFLFRRANHPWKAGDFDDRERYTRAERGPIRSSAIVELDSLGNLAEDFGDGIYYLPHGITVDQDGHLWTTDVALHQVIRLNKDTHKPDLVLGEKFVPGSDSGHFCKPTKVAVASDGHFFVADGYCNSRVMKFDATGKFLGQFGRKAANPAKPKEDEFLIPHGLALLESLDLLCVADREHRRIQCFKAGLRMASEFGKFVRSVGSGDHVGRIFDVAFAPTGELLALHQESNGISMVTVYRPETDAVVTGFTFVPNSDEDLVGFGDGHAVAVAPRGNFVLVSSLTAMCDGDVADCFGESPTEVPYQVFKFNLDL